jgi:hypothetical protein
MRTVRIALVASLLIGTGGWVGPSFSQAPPSSTGMPGIPGVQSPSIPGVPQVPGVPKGVPGFQSPSGTGSAAGTATSMLKGQDTQWTGKRCLNRGDNSLGTCQDVCRNLGVTRATDAKEYAGVCNY